MPKYAAKYVTGGTGPTGWEVYGNIAVDVNGLVSPNDYPFMPGIDESYDTSGYVIITDTTTAGIVGRPSGNNSGPTAPSNTPTYYVSGTKTVDSFLTLFNLLPARISQLPLTEPVDAKDWLNNNGYWTSYVNQSTVIPNDHIVYYTLRNDLGSQPYSPYPATLGDYITDFYRYPYYNTINSATLSASGVSGFFGNTQGYATFSQFNSVTMAYSSGTYSEGSEVAVVSYEDPISDISFIHGSGSSYSIYFVGRPEAFIDGSFATTFNIFTTKTTTGGPNIKFERLYISSEGASQGNTFSVVFESQQNVGIFQEVINKIEFEVGLTAAAFDSQPLKIFSILGQNVGNTTSISINAYVNEVLVATQSHISIPNSNDPSDGYLNIMAETLGFDKGNSYKGYFAELLIYDYMHDTTLHSNIISEMKSRWNIL